MDIALYQPDIPQNTGSIMRLSACLGMGLHVIEPCGFVLDDKKLARVAMDYADQVNVVRHSSFEAFERWRGKRRLVLLTTHAPLPYTQISFEKEDILLLGRESAGVPLDLHQIADVRVRIPLRPPARSLNVALAAAMVAGEALRQTGSFAAREAA